MPDQKLGHFQAGRVFRSNDEPDHPGGNERFQFAAAIANLLVGRQHDPALLSGPREPLLVGGGETRGSERACRLGFVTIDPTIELDRALIEEKQPSAATILRRPKERSTKKVR